MERIVEATFESNLALASFLLGSVRLPKIVDAVVCLPGEGENRRQDFAQSLVNDFRKNRAGTLFLVAGFGPNENKEIDAIKQGVANNTLEQAVWVAEIMSQFRLRNVVIVTATYHMLRAYLTILRQIEKKGFSASLFPAPVLSDNIFFEEERMEAEIQRIKTYQEKGDVASLSSLLMYLPPFSDV